MKIRMLSDYVYTEDENGVEVNDSILSLIGKGKKFDVSNNTVVDDSVTRILYLKQMLETTDYQAIKYAEGQLSAEEYEPMKQQRIKWRQEINELELSV